MTAPPLGKYLASTEKKIRDKAIQNLSVFLSESTDVLAKSDMDKLWKGIFYGFWMSDKPIVQQALANDLADLVLSISQTSSALAFLRGFWEMIVREWNGIDRLRIDKYYMLVRRFANASFRLLIRVEWDMNVIDEYNTILTTSGGPLCSSDLKAPTSLTYHLADIYVEELDKVLALSTSPATEPLPAPLQPLLTPFLLLAAQTPFSVTYKRIQSALMDPLLSALTLPSEELARFTTTSASQLCLYPCVASNSCYQHPKTEGRVDGPTLRKKLLRLVFEIASRPETRDSNRRKLYALWKESVEETEEN